MTTLTAKVITAYLIPVSLIVTQVKGAIRVQPDALINESQVAARKSLGIVKGVKSCGGSGQLLQWRYETCLDSDPVCHVPADGVSRTSQIDFIPSQNSEKLGLRLQVHSADGKINDTFDKGVIPAISPLKKDTVYTITAVGGVTEQWQGKEATFQYILYDVEDGHVEICAETRLLYV